MIDGFDGDVAEACALEIAADQIPVVIAVRRTRHEARRIMWVDFCQRL